MHRNLFSLVAGALYTAVPAIVFAQPNAIQRQNAEGAAACAACGGGFVFVFLAIIALNIALLVWVARDAKSRGMDSAAIWMILVMFTGVIGLIIYVLSRPQGNMISCPSCNNKRLEASAKCPHCGNP